MPHWDESVDLLVIGSGAAGMAGAITAAEAGAQVKILEKAEVYGGTSALSGGVVWIPDNHLMKAAGLADSESDALQYLQQVVGDGVPEARLRAYVRQAPEMLRFFEERGDIRFESATSYMDYYPELPGGKAGGRSLDPLPIDRGRVGSDYWQQRKPAFTGVGLGFTVTAREAHTLLDFNWKSWLLIARRLLVYYLDIPSRLRGYQDRRLTLGQALVGRLRRALAKRRVPLELDTRLCRLWLEGGRVVGAEVEHGGQRRYIEARRGVLLATGGFAANGAMRQQYHGFPCEQWTAASPDSTGDVITLARDIGADTAFMDCAWWSPTMKTPEGRFQALINGKSLPGSIFVNRAGRRFANEAGPYEDVVKAQYQRHRDGEDSIPCYMIFDGRFRRHYAVGMIPPAKAVPDHRLAPGFQTILKKADSLPALAEQLGIDSNGLLATVERVNALAERGVDEDFGRGESLHDRYYCDPQHSPNPTFGALREPPFYAIEIYPGDLDTKGGLRCDELARVLDVDGQPIAGLYAAGNCSAAVMGNSYPGAGATLGPAMTFAYIAAKHAVSS